MKEEKRYTDITEICYGRDMLLSARVLTDVVDFADLQLLGHLFVSPFIDKQPELLRSVWPKPLAHSAAM